jgi:hypothetical protein
MSYDEYKEEFKDLFEIALIRNKSEFLDLFLTSLIENNINRSFFKEFLDIDRLMKLYNNEAVKFDILKSLTQVI